MACCRWVGLSPLALAPALSKCLVDTRWVREEGQLCQRSALFPALPPLGTGSQMATWLYREVGKRCLNPGLPGRANEVLGFIAKVLEQVA